MMGDLTVVRDLLEFSFESTVAPDMPAAVLQRLVRRSAAFNARTGLTGCLRLDHGRFVHSLEGRASVLLPLAGRILADRRHGSIRVTAFGAIAARRFADWRAEGFGDGLAGNDSGNLHFLPARPERTLATSAAILSLGTGARLSALRDA